MSASVGSRRAGSKAWGGWAAVAVIAVLTIKLVVIAVGSVLSDIYAQAGTAGDFTDTRDGKTYRTVKIGTQTWMAENLNFKTSKSVCYDNKESNCKKYGRLYGWDDAMTACPAGWRLARDAEWTTLTDSVGGEKTAWKKLKSKSGWKDNGNGTNEYGFSALPGGYGDSGGDFYNAGYNGHWWSATDGRYLYMDYDNEYVYWSSDSKGFLRSVRCVEGLGVPVRRD